MTRLQVRVLRILTCDVARTDAELAAMTGLTVPQLKPALMNLYRLHQIDFCAGYVVLFPQPLAGEHAA